MDALDASMCRAPLEYRKLAVDALELLQKDKTRAAVAGYDVSFDAAALVPCDFRPSRAILLDDTTV